jgi:hypothetical protein
MIVEMSDEPHYAMTKPSTQAVNHGMHFGAAGKLFGCTCIYRILSQTLSPDIAISLWHVGL